MEKTADKKSWNWCAFLFTSYWMFYRKMYVEAIIYNVGISILACISTFFTYTRIAWVGIFSVVFGILFIEFFILKSIA